MSASFSHYSILQIDVATPAQVSFPASEFWPEKSCGYVRSSLRGKQSLRAKLSGETAVGDVPFRDYPDDVLTPLADLIERPYAQDHLIISARNVLNEYGYQARMGGKWWRRNGDAALDDDWPVLSVGRNTVGMAQLSEAAESGDDLVTGVPLVREGEAVSRAFLIRNCSDVAHTYAVHPRGLVGPPAEAWRALADTWEELHRAETAEEDFALTMDALAVRYNVQPSRDVLHSVIAQTRSDQLLAFGITSALSTIGAELAARWDVRSAVVLDNSGSVGWTYCQAGADEPRIVLSSSNYRPRGMVFLDFAIGGFLRPSGHPLPEKR